MRKINLFLYLCGFCVMSNSYAACKVVSQTARQVNYKAIADGGSLPERRFKVAFQLTCGEPLRQMLFVSNHNQPNIKFTTSETDNISHEKVAKGIRLAVALQNMSLVSNNQVTEFSLQQDDKAVSGSVLIPDEIYQVASLDGKPLGAGDVSGELLITVAGEYKGANRSTFVLPLSIRFNPDN